MEPTPIPPTLDDLQAVMPRVLSRLREMATFPSNGTVAGQAVASLFWEELGLPMRGPINDIDVFVNCSMPREMRGGPPRSEQTTRPVIRGQSTVSNYKGSRIKDDDYGQSRLLAMRATTGILRTYTAGLVNYTLVSTGHRSGIIGHSVAQSQELVDEFDLNLVAVGINLDDEKVVASPAFLKFLADRQVRAQTCNTPAHTMVRLVNKLHSGQLQGADCDYPAQRQMLELAIACQDRIAPVLCKEDGAGPHHITRFGSSKYRALAVKFAHLLPPTYTQVTTSGYEFTHFKVEPPATPQAKWLLDQSVNLVSLDRTGLGHMAYVARFPVLYGLFHPEMEGGQGTLKSAQRIQSFKDALAADDPEAIFRLVHFALGKEITNIPMQELSSLESANFFFDQPLDPSQPLDPARVRALADQWNALTPIEARALASSGMRALQFQRLCNDPEAGWAEVFTTNNQVVYSTLSRLRPPDPAAIGAHHLADRFLSWVVNPAAAPGNASAVGLIMRDPILRGPVVGEEAWIDTVFLLWPASPSTATHLLWHLDEDRRAQLGEALMQAKSDGWRKGPSADDLLPGVLTRMDMGLCVPDELVDRLVDSGQLRACLIGACLNIDVDAHPSAHEHLLSMADQLDPAQAFEGKSQVLRSLAYTDRGTQALEAIKERLQAHPDIVEALPEAIEFMKEEERTINDSTWSTQAPRDRLARARAVLESWDLSAKTLPGAAPSSRPPSPRF